jgi:hypothetical protein
MPPLVKAFAEALAQDPATRAWLNDHGHTLIAVLNENSGPRTGAVIEILCLMREGLLGGDNWGSVIWDHDLVPKVLEATGAGAEAKERLALVASWEGVCRYVKASRNSEEAQQRALEITERIQEVVRLAVEFELVAMG